MKIGITGASGHLGGEVLSRLHALNADHHLIALGRTSEASSEAFEWRYFDYDQPDNSIAAFAGLDRLLLVPTPDLQPGAIGRQLCAAIDAAVNAGVGQIYLLSALHAADTLTSSDLARSYTLAERLLLTRTANATVFRMSFYIETFAEIAKMALQHGTMFGLAENNVSFISRSDVASSLASALNAESLERNHYVLTGPASVTAAERSDLVARVSGRPMAYAVVTEARLRDLLSQAPMPDFIVDALVAMQKTFSEGAFDIVTDDVRTLTGQVPRSMEEVLRKLCNERD